jgi:hypothetical protein
MAMRAVAVAATAVMMATAATATQQAAMTVQKHQQKTLKFLLKWTSLLLLCARILSRSLHASCARE